MIINYADYRELWIIMVHMIFIENCLPISELYLEAVFSSQIVRGQVAPPESMRRRFNKIKPESTTFGQGMTHCRLL